jgi:hypothetical protein
MPSELPALAGPEVNHPIIAVPLSEEDPQDDYGGAFAKFEASAKRRLRWSPDKVKSQDERLWDVTKNKGFCHAND